LSFRWCFYVSELICFLCFFLSFRKRPTIGIELIIIFCIFRMRSRLEQIRSVYMSIRQVISNIPVSKAFGFLGEVRGGAGRMVPRGRFPSDWSVRFGISDCPCKQGSHLRISACHFKSLVLSRCYAAKHSGFPGRARPRQARVEQASRLRKK